MKKFLACLCMITCVFGLTACGSEEVLSDYEQQKVDYAEQLAQNGFIPLIQGMSSDESVAAMKDFTYEEIEDIIVTQYGYQVDGYALSGGIDSFRSAMQTIGSITEVGEATAEIKDDQIVVNVDITGEKKAAKAEIILSNDKFMVLEAAALNPVATISDMMVKAALNTLIGMGTVFVVLILISLMISAFSIIPKIQAKFEKKSVKEEQSKGIDNAVAQIVQQEESVDVSDDCELVAVIAAAIAASEGAVSTDGFVVRSIRKVNRSRY